MSRGQTVALVAPWFFVAVASVAAAWAWGTAGKMQVLILALVGFAIAGLSNADITNPDKRNKTAQKEADG